MLQHIKSALIGTAALFLVSTHVQAVDSGAYFGIAFGNAQDDILNESDTGIKFYGGFTIDSTIGIEFSYVDLGNYSNNALSQDGVAIEGVLYFPVFTSTDLFVKGGIFSWEVSTASASEIGTDIVFGAGIETTLNSQTSLRLEYQSFQDVSGGDVELFSVGLARYF